MAIGSRAMVRVGMGPMGVPEASQVGLLPKGQDFSNAATVIGNGDANKILKVYPPTGGNINALGVDTAYPSVSGHGVLITCLSGPGNTWLALG